MNKDQLKQLEVDLWAAADNLPRQFRHQGLGIQHAGARTDLPQVR